MAAGDVLLGLNGSFCYGAGGGTPSTVAENVDEVKLSMSKRFAEWIKRNVDYVGKKPTVRECQLTFKVYDIEGDAFLAAILAEWAADARIALYPKDATSGTGLDADWYVECQRSEDNQGVITYEVTAHLTDEARQPSWG